MDAVFSPSSTARRALFFDSANNSMHSADHEGESQSAHAHGATAGVSSAQQFGMMADAAAKLQALSQHDRGTGTAYGSTPYAQAPHTPQRRSAQRDPVAEARLGRSPDFSSVVPLGTSTVHAHGTAYQPASVATQGTQFTTLDSIRSLTDAVRRSVNFATAARAPVEATSETYSGDSSDSMIPSFRTDLHVTSADVLSPAAHATAHAAASRAPTMAAVAASEAQAVDILADHSGELSLLARSQQVQPLKPQGLGAATPASGAAAAAAAADGQKAGAPAPSPASEWRSAVAPNGRVYYYHSRTRESCWQLPADVPQQLVRPSSSAARATQRPATSQPQRAVPSESAAAAALLSPSRRCNYCGATGAPDWLFAWHVVACATAAAAANASMAGHTGMVPMQVTAVEEQMGAGGGTQLGAGGDSLWPADGTAINTSVAGGANSGRALMQSLLVQERANRRSRSAGASGRNPLMSPQPQLQQPAPAPTPASAAVRRSTGQQALHTVLPGTAALLMAAAARAAVNASLGSADGAGAEAGETGTLLGANMSAVMWEGDGTDGPGGVSGPGNDLRTVVAVASPTAMPAHDGTVSASLESIGTRAAATAGTPEPTPSRPPVAGGAAASRNQQQLLSTTDLGSTTMTARDLRGEMDAAMAAAAASHAHGLLVTPAAARYSSHFHSAGRALSAVVPEEDGEHDGEVTAHAMLSAHNRSHSAHPTGEELEAEVEAAALETERTQCGECGRWFAPSRLAVHAKACTFVFGKHSKRSPFPTHQVRVKDTAADSLNFTSKAIPPCSHCGKRFPVEEDARLHALACKRRPHSSHHSAGAAPNTSLLDTSGGAGAGAGGNSTFEAATPATVRRVRSAALPLSSARRSRSGQRTAASAVLATSAPVTTSVPATAAAVELTAADSGADGADHVEPVQMVTSPLPARTARAATAGPHTPAHAAPASEVAPATAGLSLLKRKLAHQHDGSVNVSVGLSTRKWVGARPQSQLAALLASADPSQHSGTPDVGPAEELEDLPGSASNGDRRTPAVPLSAATEPLPPSAAPGTNAASSAATSHTHKQAGVAGRGAWFSPVPFALHQLDASPDVTAAAEAEAAAAVAAAVTSHLDGSAANSSAASEATPEAIAALAPVACGSCGVQLRGAAQLCAHLVECGAWLSQLQHPAAVPASQVGSVAASAHDSSAHQRSPGTMNCPYCTTTLARAAFPAHVRSACAGAASASTRKPRRPQLAAESGDPGVLSAQAAGVRPSRAAVAEAQVEAAAEHEERVSAVAKALFMSPQPTAPATPAPASALTMLKARMHDSKASAVKPPVAAAATAGMRPSSVLAPSAQRSASRSKSNPRAVTAPTTVDSMVSLSAFAGISSPEPVHHLVPQQQQAQQAAAPFVSHLPVLHKTAHTSTPGANLSALKARLAAATATPSAGISTPQPPAHAATPAAATDHKAAATALASSLRATMIRA